MQQKIIVVILSSIIITGIIGIPIGNPKFFTNAIALETVFIALTVVAVWRLRYIIIPNMIIAVIVIAGNTASPRHIEIMSTFDPLENAIVLIVGGYILQGLLLITSVLVFKSRKQLKSEIK